MPPSRVCRHIFLYVESGEGIERLPLKWNDVTLVSVESGEGIERYINSGFSCCHEDVESGEGIERKCRAFHQAPLQSPVESGEGIESQHTSAEGAERGRRGIR